MSTQLEELLDQTRDALIAGNFAALYNLSAQVEALADAFPRVDRPTADRLRRKADRNARLLQAATRGIKAARQRLSDIAAASTLSTYDARGRRDVIPGPSAFQPRRV